MKNEFRLTDERAEPCGNERRAQLDQRQGQVGEEQAGDVTHQTLSVQIPQLRQQGVHHQSDAHEHRRQQHPDGVHGEQKIAGLLRRCIGEADYRRYVVFI